MQMATYQITFYKKVLNSSGHEIQSVQQEISVRLARSVERAVKAAELRFAHRHRTRNWKTHADLLELKIDGRKVTFAPEEEWDLKCIPGAC